MLVDLKELNLRLRFHRKKYGCSESDPYEFDEFWRWKLEVEAQRNKHILDDDHREETYQKLVKAFPKWKVYRPCKYSECFQILEVSLEEIAEAYDEIRTYNLLEFDKIPVKPLELIWHELGRVKEHGGKIGRKGYYYIVAVSKPLLFLWGQTLAFDSIVRSGIPKFGLLSYVINDTRWTFENWKKVLGGFQADLCQQPEIVAALRKVAEKKYKSARIVPYGRFLDIYYYVAPDMM